MSWVVVLSVWVEVVLYRQGAGQWNLLVGKAYTAMLGLDPGAEFDIKLGKKAIRLVPVGGMRKSLRSEVW